MTTLVQSYSDSRYLEAKRTVDDRSLNHGVLRALRAEIARRSGAPLKILELGAGTGTMAARLADWQVLHRGEYVLLDADRELLSFARKRIASLGRAHGERVEEQGDCIAVRGADVDLSFRFVNAELHSYLESSAAEAGFDLVIANAFLDIVDVPFTLSTLFGRATPGASYWFSINFDGETAFLPEHSDDAALLAVYHRSMDERVRDGHRTGDSKTGRHLFEHLQKAGASISAAGSSDWVVYAEGGSYLGDEAYFLHHLVHTVRLELEKHPEVQREVLERWCALRHAQVERGELKLIAHQLDFFGRVQASSD